VSGRGQQGAAVRLVVRRRPGRRRPTGLSERGRQVHRGRVDGGRRVRFRRDHRPVRRVLAGQYLY